MIMEIEPTKDIAKCRDAAVKELVAAIKQFLIEFPSWVILIE